MEVGPRSSSIQERRPSKSIEKGISLGAFFHVRGDAWTLTFCYLVQLASSHSMHSHLSLARLFLHSALCLSDVFGYKGEKVVGKPFKRLERDWKELESALSLNADDLALFLFRLTENFPEFGPLETYFSPFVDLLLISVRTEDRDAWEQAFSRHVMTAFAQRQSIVQNLQQILIVSSDQQVMERCLNGSSSESFMMEGGIDGILPPSLTLVRQPSTIAKLSDVLRIGPRNSYPLLRLVLSEYDDVALLSEVPVFEEWLQVVFNYCHRSLTRNQTLQLSVKDFLTTQPKQVRQLFKRFKALIDKCRNRMVRLGCTDRRIEPITPEVLNLSLSSFLGLITSGKDCHIFSRYRARSRRSSTCQTRGRTPHWYSRKGKSHAFSFSSSLTSWWMPTFVSLAQRIRPLFHSEIFQLPI